jgi:hypothetical protein
MDYKPRKGGFNAVLIIDFVFTNPTPRPARDITVTCTHADHRVKDSAKMRDTVRH